MRSAAPDSYGHRLWGGGTLALPHHLTDTIHHAYRRFGLRHVKSDELFLHHDRLHLPGSPVLPRPAG